MKISRIMMTILLIFTILGTCGCNKEKEKEEELDVIWKIDCNSTDERLYETLVRQKKQIYSFSSFDAIKQKEGMEKYDGVYSVLTYMMVNNIDDEDKQYHVLLWYWGMNDITNRADGLMTQDIVDEINEKYNRDFQLDEWVQIQEALTYYYYGVFTADEILDLADFGIKCHYVGSGEGNIEDVNFNTPEGMLEFCELYGDIGVIQYKKGQKLYY